MRHRRNASRIARDLDYVKVHGSHCPIKQIRPVDYGRLQTDLRREHEVQPASATAAGSKPAES